MDRRGIALLTAAVLLATCSTAPAAPQDGVGRIREASSVFVGPADPSVTTARVRTSLLTLLDVTAQVCHESQYQAEIRSHIRIARDLVEKDSIFKYGAPQDMEWAFANGKLYILQARGITSLFPVPQVSFDPLIVWFSFGAVQGLLGPLTPLGQDAIMHLVIGGGTMFHVTLKYGEIDVFVLAGERIWIKVSDMLRHPAGARIYEGVLPSIEPSVAQILIRLANDPRLGVGTGKFKFSTIRKLGAFALPILARLARDMLFPASARARLDASSENYINEKTIAPGANRFERLANVVAFMKDRIKGAFTFLLPQFISIFGPSMAGLNLLTLLSGDSSLALEVTRGLPNNVTTEMDPERNSSTLAGDSPGCRRRSVRGPGRLDKARRFGSMLDA